MNREEANKELARLSDQFKIVVGQITDLCDKYKLTFYPGLGVYPEIWYNGEAPHEGEENNNSWYGDTNQQGWVSSAHSC